MEETEQIYQGMYLHLFNVVTDALAALERGQTEKAKALLIQAQQDCEELYMRG
jgi:hypothetical protein